MEDFYIDESKIINEIERIANLLLLKKILKVNELQARFTEIEFYYYCTSHDDGFTHEHNLPTGRWRFHNQGLDITLKGNTGFGGVLIRGVEINGDYINGPRRVLFKVMNALKPVAELQNSLGLIVGEVLDHKIFKTYRHGLASPSKTLSCKDYNHFINADYRYLVSPQNFDKKQFAGAERIASKFDEDMRKEFLGYNLNSDKLL